MLQNDLIDLYNMLVVFSNRTLDEKLPERPIEVKYDIESRQVVFTQEGQSVRTQLPVYYCLGLEDLIKPSYLLPEDYDYLMRTLQNLAFSGELIKDRTCLSPENYGFDIYGINLKEFEKGPTILGQIRIVSGTGWLFRHYIKFKYKI